MRALVGATLALAALTAACGHNPIERRLDQPIYYLDNTLPFQPKRIWRLWVKWDPYLLDNSKAMVTKEFQLVVHDAAERRKLESEIAAYGGDTRYLRWLESEVFPIGNWEKREDARIARYSDLTVVVINTKSIKEVPQSGHLNVAPVFFPDYVFRSVTDGCHELNWDVIPIGDSVGTEVVLESRDLIPGADRWKTIEKDLPNFSWKAWSVGQERRIAYRTFLNFKTNVSRCPLPPKIHEEFKRIAQVQSMGVDW
jgi:hypothetical protein